MSNVNAYSGLNTNAGGFGGAQSITPTAQPADMRSWYEAMAKAWGNVLDGQAGRITNLSSQIGEGGQDNPGTMLALTTESLRMQFLSQNASTSTGSVGQALEALARK
jgi:hypothetical protein